MKMSLKTLMHNLYLWFTDTLLYRYVISALLHPKNFLFCLKYPFWKSTNVWTGKFMGYYTTWYDHIPAGWRKAFGSNLTDDIAKALIEDNIPKSKWKKSVYWEQIKEKYGTLRLYCSTTEKVQHVLSKYELLSYGYCIVCGKPARYRTKGWVEYYCEDCMLNNINNSYKLKNGTKKYLYEEEYRIIGYKKDRLTKKDIPEMSRYDYDKNKSVKINIKKEYGIDLEELWGIKG